MARGEWETARRRTRRGEGQRPRESTLDLECPSYSGHRSGFGLGMQTCASTGLNSTNEEGPYVSAGPPRGWVLCIRGVGFGRPPAKGAWLGRGRRSRSPKTGRVGQAGRRTCRQGTQVRTGLPAPQPRAAQPARPRRGISEGPRSLRLRGSPPQTGGPAPTPQYRSGMWAAAASGRGPAAAAIAGRGQRETRGCAGRHFT